MRKHVQRAFDTLQALDFHLDHEDRKIRTDRWVFTHSNDPDQRLILNYRMSDAAASKVIRHAEAIVGLASTETDPAERARQRDKQARRDAAERARAVAASKRLADQKDAEIQAARAKQYAARQNRGTLTADDQATILANIRGEWIAPTRIADELCIPMRKVQAAINTEELPAYMHHGRRVLCKVAEVRAWIRQNNAVAA